MRLFLAINLPDALRRATYDAAEPLRAAAPHASWVREDKLHLTLKFLGDVDEARLPELHAAFGVAAARHCAIPLEVGRFGAFPNWRRPRILWAGIAPDPKLELLQHDLEVAGEAVGFEGEGRPFRPHVTVARLRAPLGDEERRTLAGAARAARLRGGFVAERVELMQSDPAAGGAPYRPLAAYPFMAFAPLRSL